MVRLRSLPRIFIPLVVLLWAIPALAQDYNGDLALEAGSIRTENYVIAGKNVRIYATVKNNSVRDLFGTVKFYDEKKGAFIGSDQPVSVLANGTDDVFVDWEAKTVGEFPISARVIPWDEKGDNPDNNKVTTNILVDVDSDNDGIPNSQDPDDDNDGVNDVNDAFPKDSKESMDTDNDGIGNNTDEDDDGDKITDIQDLFPTDPNESKDTDEDGYGDNSDAFPTDAKEWKDSDNDNLGDNSDPFPEHPGPVAQIETENNVVPAGTVLAFNALKSRARDGEIVSYEWDFGQGVESTSVIVDKTFDKPGTYDVKLKVTDDKGEFREAKITITVIHRWQTFILIGIILLLFLLLVYYIVSSKKVLAKKKKKT